MESRLESVNEEQKPAESIQRENKYQLDLCMIYISFIARNDKKIRKEFLLGCLEGIEFLMIEADEDKDIQLRMSYFQLDNNAIGDSP